MSIICLCRVMPVDHHLDRQHAGCPPPVPYFDADADAAPSRFKSLLVLAPFSGSPFPSSFSLTPALRRLPLPPRQPTSTSARLANTSQRPTAGAGSQLPVWLVPALPVPVPALPVPALPVPALPVPALPLPVPVPMLFTVIGHLGRPTIPALQPANCPSPSDGGGGCCG